MARGQDGGNFLICNAPTYYLISAVLEQVGIVKEEVSGDREELFLVLGGPLFRNLPCYQIIDYIGIPGQCLYSHKLFIKKGILNRGGRCRTILESQTGKMIGYNIFYSFFYL